ncbi:Glutaconyl-CoA decarboxylase subunit beta [Novipirellula galeiformis]|uniref:Glutaconyl-CoA decarboxylase subunit beta n=1 Tax=Novipirellula galeiformis TaxID=2528004 RepID=A0A5C6C8Z1_9BACT|nr:sodium ion-translocating decarboxylase subunit beta [Novipirellula galeiformis]TWU21173.1 Glutaconyl-CoA decarboxylase subunit beta [Novipirellula galeiformis]
MDIIFDFLKTTGFWSMTFGNAIMIIIGIFFITLAIVKDYEPLLLVPIGMGAVVGNIPTIAGMSLSVYDVHSWQQIGDEIIYQPGSVLSYIYFGVNQGLYPPLIFLGIGAMTDFSTMLSNPKLILLGAAAQIGVFLTFLGALFLEFNLQEAGAIGIIGGADGPTAIFLSAKLAPHLLGAIAIAAYSYMALVPVIQPPIMRLLTTREERLIRMKAPRNVSKREKMIFPIAAFLITTLIAPGAVVLLGMLFFGNLLKESLVTERLANTARNAMIDIVTILLGFSVGASTQADTFLRPESLLIFGLGALSFAIATAGGVLFAKFMNLFLTDKINPLVGAAGVSAVPDSARVVQMVGQQEDPHNFLLMHAMAPNVAGVIGSAIAAGVLWAVLVKESF